MTYSKNTYSKMQLEKELKIGTLTSEFPLKQLIQDAIINETFDDYVNISFLDLFGGTVTVKQKISDYLTYSEYNDIQELNFKGAL